MRPLFKTIAVLLLLGTVLSIQAKDSLSLTSKTGDTLMIHRLNNGELWGSFMITDQIVDSFADNELIILQVDHNKPIKLDHQKQCGGGLRQEQKVGFLFDKEADHAQWQFSQLTTNKPEILKLVGWDNDSFHHMRSDRRPEVVDFPIQGELAVDLLWQQFKQGDIAVFRYTTESGETRQAKFKLSNISDKLQAPPR
ncbi:MAG: hypothetical protein OEY48_02120 [Gammaproteobacteria bacterium]|nr:hypothetical protein [Gammaproteobacteria bacterium]MDH5591625.1 hypothetical protein [Gammaproteobacteria bacterium]